MRFVKSSMLKIIIGQILPYDLAAHWTCQESGLQTAWKAKKNDRKV